MISADGILKLAHCCGNRICYNIRMKRCLFLPALVVLSGCLTATSPSVSYWMLECAGVRSAVSAPRYGAVRIAQVVVAAPYETSRLTVLRADGTVAFDPYNEIAASPSMLLKGVLRDAAIGSGLFGSVVGASSALPTTVSLEVVVTRLALDCRKEDERRAVASVLVRLSNREGVALGSSGTGEADAADGNYGKAMSTAMSMALAEAFGKLR